MSRNILLIEPNYSNKYPPIGLMKIATYHRRLGDRVRFFKGELDDLLVDNLYESCLKHLNQTNTSIVWDVKAAALKDYIKNKSKKTLEALYLPDTESELLITRILDYYHRAFKKKLQESYPKYDRIYVTTLFTFYWKITIQTIEFCKKLVHTQNELYIGGVLASLLHKEVEITTGIKPIQGLLDKPGMLDPDNPMARNLIIDDLPLDYSILYEVTYEYPTRSAFFTFMTKGCTRKCSFCSVPILEPTYKPKIETFDKFSEIKNRFGDQQNLLLMDNNVLASPKFIEIIDEIKSMGFHKGATFVEPNQLDLAIKNLKEGYNEVGFVRRAHFLLNDFMPRLKEPHKQLFYNILHEYQIHKYETTTKENLIAAYPHLEALYERYRNKSPKLRYVDFNQGTDARYVTEEIMKKMSEIPIRPLRIAFDYIGLKKQYVNAVKLAAKYGIKELSNYILYNFQDKPEDLYERLRINADLCKELNVAIFSFPMKYIPLFGEEAKHREFTGKNWNKKFIRAIQSILNVTKGIVAPSHQNEKTSFFEEAFGKDLNDFFEILYMPETYIIYRHLFRYDFKYTTIWETEYRNLSEFDRKLAQSIIQKNIFTPEALANHELSDVVKHFLRHYTIYRGSIDKEDGQYRRFRTQFDGLIKNEPFTDLLTTEALPKEDEHYKKLKTKFDTLIKEDPFIDLTLTYDFENEVVEVK